MFLPYAIERPLGIRPWATIGLIAVNVLVFAAMIPLNDMSRELVYLRWGFVPEEAARAHTLFTSQFLHGGLLHLAGNMFFLWIFGRTVEERLGLWRYLAFYVAAGVLAGLTHMAFVGDDASDIPCVGASGAISGLLGAFLVLAPTVRVRCLYVWISFVQPIYGKVRVPAVVFLGGWFGGQLLYGLLLSDMPEVMGVAFWAHVGGFVFGSVVVGSGPTARALRRLARAQGREARWRSIRRAGTTGDWARATELLDKACAQDKSPGAHLARARAQLQAGRTAKAQAQALLALRAAARARRPGDLAGAYALLQATVHGQQDGEALHPGLRDRDCLSAARALRTLGQVRACQALLLAALGRYPLSEETPRFLYELGDLCLARQDTSCAERAFGLLQGLYPESTLARSVAWSGGRPQLM